MAVSVQQDILSVLKASPVSLKALDIARKTTPPRSKKEINQVIYDMKELERANPGLNPPLWRIAQQSPVSPTMCPPPEPVPLPMTRAQSASVAPAASSSVYVHTKHQDGTLSFTPVGIQASSDTSASSEDSPHTMSSLSPSTAPIQEAYGILCTSQNEQLVHGTTPLGDCTTTAVSESGFTDTVPCTSACEPCTTPQRKGGSKRKFKLSASFKVDHVPQGGDLAASDRVPQKQNLTVPEEDCATPEVERLVDEIRFTKI